ncbi:MAG: acyl-CoA dehydrogenase family protein, partial [Desulfobacterales bacterium]|nr:acyl-CoA dehydrogenase family protein [Desulfobacterales bacterium]
MDFSLSPEHEILRESVRSFAENEIQPVARELDEKEEFSYVTMQKMAELGLFGVFVSEKYGGQAMDYVSYIIAVEEIARVDGSHAATVAAENSLGIGPLYYFGNEDQKRRHLPKLCKGETLWGFGLTEPNAGSDAAGSRTTAVLDGNAWVINGSKIFITNAATKITAGVTVLARTGVRADGKPELSCILVEAGTPGFSARPMHGKMMWRSSNTAELYFEDCRVPQDNLLGPRGQGFHQMMQTL